MEHNAIRKWAIIIVSTYKYLMPALMVICFFVLPFLRPKPYLMGSHFVDLSVRGMLWLYFAFAYWSLAYGLINQINITKICFRGLHKNISSLLQFLGGALAFGVFFYILTRWSLFTFVQLQDNVVIGISLVNGLSFAVLYFSRYIWLLEDD